MRIIGKTVSCAEVIKECLRDRPFYLESGGGITLTGGEPTYQVSFSETILRMAHEEGIHTAVETNGCCHWSALERLAQHTDLFLFDLKILERSKSSTVTGADSVVVLENLERIKAMGRNLVIRFPFIPGYTDDSDNICRILEVASKLGADTEVQVLPFHQYGKHKYSALGYDYALGSRVALSREQVLSALAKYEHHCKVKVLG
jgi:pyruvate formate lyase activating enzyme